LNRADFAVILVPPVPHPFRQDPKETQMQKILLAAAAAALLAAGTCRAEPAAIPAAASAPAPQAPSPQVDEAKGLIKTFAGTLKGELESGHEGRRPYRGYQDL
jgi:hypothetical protein